MFMHAGLTDKQLLFNSIAFLSQTELLTHFESVSVALLLTETYFLRIQTILEMTWDTEKILSYIQDTFICNRIFYFMAYNNICE